MHAIQIRPGYIVMGLIAAPFLAFGACVAWLVTPVIIREVVPEVIRAVKGV